MSDALLAIFVVAYAVPRLYLFPRYVILPTLLEAPDQCCHCGVPFLWTVPLYFLQALHVYWFTHIVRVVRAGWGCGCADSLSCPTALWARGPQVKAALQGKVGLPREFADAFLCGNQCLSGKKGPPNGRINQRRRCKARRRAQRGWGGNVKILALHFREVRCRIAA